MLYFLLCLSSLSRIDRLGCLLQELIEEDDENFKGFVNNLHGNWD